MKKEILMIVLTAAALVGCNQRTSRSGETANEPAGANNAPMTSTNGAATTPSGANASTNQLNEPAGAQATNKNSLSTNGNQSGAQSGSQSGTSTNNQSNP